MTTVSAAQAKGLRDSEGTKILIWDCERKVRTVTIRLRKVMCGKKNCTKCPHESYAYARYRVGKKVHEKYLGVAR